MNLKTILLLTILFSFPFTTMAQDGSLDTSFGVSGIVTTAVGVINSMDLSSGSAKSVAIQNDGKILVAGQSYNGLN